MSSTSLQAERKQLISDIFDMFDKNENGTIQASELHSVLESLGRSSTDDDVNQFLMKLDVNENGVISKEEFISAVDEIYSFPQSTVDEVVQAFQIFDINGSGKITVDEMKTILLKFTNEFNEDDVNAIFELIDVDQDGKVSYAEFAEIWKFQ
jgi:Ca2+-binding EF-hand superfamily protein